MREIKFRAWDIGLKRWLFEDINLYSSERDEGEIVITVGGIADSGIVFQQFTGLKDKNGKEIYEGDILEEKHRCTWEHYIVCFGEHEESEGNKNRSVGFYLKAFRKDNKKYQIIILDPKYLEYSKIHSEGYKVIGNIHENPELLKENKKC